MSQRFTIADLHLGHEKTCTTFKQPDGVTPLRPFANADEMDEEIVKRWNAKVGKNDTVVVLGDVVINKKNLPTLARLNGRKKLVPGNHDVLPAEEYLKYFYDIQGYQVYEREFIMSHIPVHPDALGRFKANVHGHYHAHRVTLGPHGDLDSRYLCVSVEQTNFEPLSYDEVRARLKAQSEANW